MVNPTRLTDISKIWSIEGLDGTDYDIYQNWSNMGDLQVGRFFSGYVEDSNRRPSEMAKIPFKMACYYDTDLYYNYWEYAAWADNDNQGTRLNFVFFFFMGKSNILSGVKTWIQLLFDPHNANTSSSQNMDIADNNQYWDTWNHEYNSSHFIAWEHDGQGGFQPVNYYTLQELHNGTDDTLSTDSPKKDKEVNIWYHHFPQAGHLKRIATHSNLFPNLKEVLEDDPSMILMPGFVESFPGMQEEALL